MKRIENCELNEMVRPVFDGWHDDSGAWSMRQEMDYFVHRFHPDPKGRLHGPYSFVKLRGGDGNGYVLNYGRMVLGRLEPSPSLSDLLTMPQEFWTSSNGQYYDNGLNRERFQQLVAQAKEQGVKISISRPLRAKTNDRTYVLNMANIGAAASMTRQATTMLSLIIESGKADGITENELADLLRQNGFKLNTKQDPWKIFAFYKKGFIDLDVLEVREAGA